MNNELRPGKENAWTGWFKDTWRIRLLNDNVRATDGGPVTITSKVFTGVEPNISEPPPPTNDFISLLEFLKTAEIKFTDTQIQIIINK